jgi:CHAD domain-containing protein
MRHCPTAIQNDSIGCATRLAQELEECRFRYHAMLKSCRRRMASQPVHRLRVEARRLQGRLELVSAILGRSSVRKLLHAIDGQLRSLGPLRDNQVQIKRLHTMASSIPGLGPMLDRLRRRRRRIVGMAVKRLKAGRFNKQIYAVEEELNALPKSAEADRQHRSCLARSIFGTRQRAQRLLTKAKAGPDELHHARIALKRYRFMLEALSPPGKPRELKRIALELSMLGKVHDLDVLLARVDKSARRNIVAQATAAILRRRLDRQRKALLTKRRGR